MAARAHAAQTEVTSATATRRVTSAHVAIATALVAQRRYSSASIDIAAASTATRRFTSTHLEIITPARRPFVGWGVPVI